MSVSPLSTLTKGRFQLLIADRSVSDAKNVRRIVFCSGKVYFDLQEARQLHDLKDVAIIRIEQLYPFPVEQYAAMIEQYAGVRDVVWCQEEPQNQGAWYQIRHRLQEPLNDEQTLYYAGRPGAAAPASGIFKVHLQQQQALVEAALDFKFKASKSRKAVKKARKT
jgi:2-oxoglutarate dehydrogenase E1 component